MAAPAQPPARRARLTHEAVLFALLAVEWFYFNSIGPRFGSLDNTFDILRHSVEIGLLALALTPIILTGGIDLSVGSLLGLCAVVFGKLWRDAGGLCVLYLRGGAQGRPGPRAGRLRSAGLWPARWAAGWPCSRRPTG